MKQPKIVLLIFVSGKVVLTGECRWEPGTQGARACGNTCCSQNRTARFDMCQQQHEAAGNHSGDTASAGQPERLPCWRAARLPYFAPLACTCMHALAGPIFWPKRLLSPLII